MKEGNTVAVIGGGGREHALVNQYTASPDVDRVICIPGNPMMLYSTKKEVKIFREYNGKRLTPTSVGEIVEICQKEEVNLVDVSQDNAIEAGVADATRSTGILTVGPSKGAGRIEWDKGFGRNLSREEKIPIPEYVIFGSERSGILYLKTQPDKRRAVKAAFLAEGKGVASARNNREARAKIRELRRRFPEAASKYLLEEWMLNDDGTPGEEFSAFFISDGTNWQFLGVAQDYKLSESGDRGENTGSMGGNSPTYCYTEPISNQTELIADKVFSGLRKRGIPYQGVLYISGIILDIGGKKVVKIVEYNSRWGDPEAQLIVPGIQNFFEVNMGAAQGDVGNITVKTDGKKRVAVAGVSRGYPGNYDAVKGKRIDGLDEIMERDGIFVFGAGVDIDKDGYYIVAGGRIFHIVGEAENFIDAREIVLAAMSRVSVEGNNLHFRPDIGWRDIERERSQRDGDS